MLCLRGCSSAQLGEMLGGRSMATFLAPAVHGMRGFCCQKDKVAVVNFTLAALKLLTY